MSSELLVGGWRVVAAVDVLSAAPRCFKRRGGVGACRSAAAGRDGRRTTPCALNLDEVDGCPVLRWHTAGSRRRWAAQRASGARGRQNSAQWVGCCSASKRHAIRCPTISAVHSDSVLVARYCVSAGVAAHGRSTPRPPRRDWRAPRLSTRQARLPASALMRHHAAGREVPLRLPLQSGTDPTLPPPSSRPCLMLPALLPSSMCSNLC